MKTIRLTSIFNIKFSQVSSPLITAWFLFCFLVLRFTVFVVHGFYFSLRCVYILTDSTSEFLADNIRRAK